MKSTSKLGRDGRFWGLVMIAPTIIGLMILNIIPFFQTIYMSFSKTKAFGAYQFCGLENYLEMFRNAEFWKANWNSIYFCILTVPVGVFLALIVAVLLNAKIKGKTAFRAIFFLPMVSPTLFVVLIMRLMASLKVYDLIYMMVEQTNPALTSAQSLMYLFYRESFVAGNKGYASAIVVWTVLLIGLVTLVQFIGQKKWVNYEV